MNKKRIAIVQFPGSNCERETAMAVKRVGMQPCDVFWNTKDDSLSEFDGFVLVGGFSYEDRLSAGVIAAVSPLMKQIKKEAEKGKPVLGICNGAQILVASGLVPGIKSQKIGCALHDNIREVDGEVLRHTYINDWCDIKPKYINQQHAFTNQFTKGKSIRIPYAHAQGRFVISEDLLEKMHQEESAMMEYVGLNPNGSTDNLAAISNRQGNIMAIMPHPERVQAGDIIFKSMKHYLENNIASQLSPTHYDVSAPVDVIHKLPDNPEHYRAYVKLIIEDNTAKSLELVLRQHDILAKVSRYRYIEFITKKSYEAVQKLLSQSIMFMNHSKEKLCADRANDLSFLVLLKLDVYHDRFKQNIAMHKEFKDVDFLNRGVVYGFDGDAAHLERLKQYLLKHHLIFNPYVEDCYELVDVPC